MCLPKKEGKWGDQEKCHLIETVFGYYKRWNSGFIFVRLDLVQNNQKKFLPDPQTRVTRSGQSAAILECRGEICSPEVKCRFEFQIFPLRSLIPSYIHLPIICFKYYSTPPSLRVTRRESDDSDDSIHPPCASSCVFFPYSVQQKTPLFTPQIQF